MFFNVKGFYWTMAAIALVIAICAIDLRCSSGAREGVADVGAMARVRNEIAAGKQQAALQREENRNLQIRDLRVMARRLVKEGRHAEARKMMAAIQELENQDTSKGKSK